MNIKRHLNTLAMWLQRPEVRVAVILLVFCSMASADVSAMADGIQDKAKPWIFWTIRILAGAMAGGGVLSLINGFTGNSEGFKKAAEVFGGLILMGVGIYCLTTPGTIYTTLSLDKMFSAATT